MKSFKISILFFSFLFVFTACSDDDDTFVGDEQSYDYSFHNGQTVPSAPYAGIHPTDFSAELSIKENEDGTADITVNLKNTVADATYRIHAHDAADPATTPNGTPYNETPNGDVLATMAMGNGGDVSVTQTTNTPYSEIVSSYAGFFVIHDPLQAISTTDISTYLVVGTFAADEQSFSLESNTFSYDFNTGQLVPDFAYDGSHPSNLSATIQVDELFNDRSRVTVRLMNSINGETYRVHAHDMADPATTPNGTPYNETPNSDIYASAVEGNGGMAGAAVISDVSYNEITTNYDGFFVVHDPLQALSTVDPTTYVILGVFAR